jgi:thiosulfate/3-mercaptopyruvate sulfurtransferase
MELNATWYGMVLKPDDRSGNQHRRVRYLERLGIDQTSEIVVSSSDRLHHAARVCWFLRFLGYRAALLDGGLAGWLGLPQAASKQTPDFAESSNPPVSPQAGFYLFASEAVPLLGAPGVQFLDLRNDSERSGGEYRTISMPGALNLSRDSLTDASGLILGPASLNQLVGAAGIDIASHLVLIAPTGLDTATVWLALTLMGASRVTIVDGGWSQWLANPDAPRITS